MALPFCTMAWNAAAAAQTVAAADCEQRENVEAVGQQSADRIDERQHLLVEVFAWFFWSAMTLPFVARSERF